MSVVTSSHALTRGVVFIHATPVVLCPHLGWAIETVLGQPVKVSWTAQPLGSSLVRAELSWTGEPGTGALLASALRGCQGARFEVVEEPSPGHDGSRWSYTPSLGIHHAYVAANGDVMVTEERLRTVLATGDHDRLRRELETALGQPWDNELEPFRHAGENAPVRWLHRVG
ncbi:MAG: DUF3145 domain-containing protein [Austwickia sp.]|nr:DUF3145 domain-containing protein [Austwickia sp.]MBK8435162.1 DUF3145 domain-containing protein [Austwickia sp.]MBK9101284.1 DUF3145 domain-containing protein [Austwickia sp.]